MNYRQRQLYEKHHDKLMQMINSYSISQQQNEYLRKVKEETELDIALRYLKSQSNKNYIFPLKNKEYQDEVEDFPGRVSFQQTLYDLNDQNYLPYKQKIQKTTISRRVKSLGSQKTHQHNLKIRVAQRVVTERETNANKLRLPKIQSSKIFMKSLERQASSSIQEKKAIKIKLGKNKNKATYTQKQFDKYGVLLTKKLLTETQQIVQIGAAKISINRRIHSPIKYFNKHSKMVQKF